ncbi:MAG: transcriptional repressor LexA [Armatimonadota bacterium]
MSKNITGRQRSVLEFIAKYTGLHGYSPAIRDIGEAMEIKSLRGVTAHLDALENKGYIHRENKSRSIQILKMPDQEGANSFTDLPVLGTIAAGLPLLAVENIEGYVPVPSAMLGTNTNAYLLRVRGDSMIGAHILPDDTVLIRPQQTAENGDLVAALLDEEATIKRLHIDENEIILMPANDHYNPIKLIGTDIKIIGKVIGLLRSY